MNMNLNDHRKILWRRIQKEDWYYENEKDVSSVKIPCKFSDIFRPFSYSYDKLTQNVNFLLIHFVQFFTLIPTIYLVLFQDQNCSIYCYIKLLGVPDSRGFSGKRKLREPKSARSNTSLYLTICQVGLGGQKSPKNCLRSY